MSDQQQIYKCSIEVIVKINKSGQQTPLYIVWENGIRYAIERVLEIRPSASSVGGSGLLYRCTICGEERRLFLDRNSWFMESYKPVN